ncbi:MAG: hypothetical protein K2V38_00785, partial [Gemmataceae bacterium]|nr:hypothetical protein [Gemmataceae bacterium]
WTGFPWQDDAVAEYFADDAAGRMALGIRGVSGNGSAMLLTPPVAFSTRHVRITLDYHTEDGVRNFHLKFLPTTTRYLTAYSVRFLPSTGGQWRTVTFDAVLVGTGGQFEFHNAEVGPRSRARLGAFVVREGQPEPPLRTDGLRSVDRFDLSGLKPFRANFPSDPDAAGWRDRWTDEVLGHCWRKESAVEFAVEATDRGPAIGVTNLNDVLSSQILFNLGRARAGLVPGKRYHARAEYRTRGDGFGQLTVRNPKDGDYPTISAKLLDLTNGEWKSSFVTFVAPATGGTDLIIENLTVGAGNTVFVRALEVFEAGPESADDGR